MGVVRGTSADGIYTAPLGGWADDEKVESDPGGGDGELLEAVAVLGAGEAAQDLLFLQIGQGVVEAAGIVDVGFAE